MYTLKTYFAIITKSVGNINNGYFLQVPNVVIRFERNRVRHVYIGLLFKPTYDIRVCVCSIQSIRNRLGTVGKVRKSFVYPKRKHILSQCIDSSEQEIHAKSLKRNCTTR